MKKQNLILFVITLLLAFSNLSNAALVDRGSGLIYDTDLNITWLQNANYSGSMIWADAVSWSNSLVYADFDDWRLPYSDTCSTSPCSGSEMGHLFYTEGITSGSSGIFTDVKPSLYWSGTEYADDTTQAWRFNFSAGTQGTSSKDQKRYAWAVRDGDSVAPPVAPEPVSSLLFITGGVVLTASRLRKIKRKI